MKAAVERTNRPEVVGGLGGFAGLFALDTAKYSKPLLASSTDGVGTKIALARQLDRHDTVGIDLVAMVVDDLVACGAEPLFLQDYVACGKVVPERIAAIVTGIAAGCTLAGAALVGGETAEHGDLMDADEYDLAATAVGVVEADAVLGPERVARRRRRHRDGVVRVPLQRLLAGPPGGEPPPGSTCTATPAGLDRPLGEELLEPTRIYARDCLALVEALGVERVHAFAHITGGGLAGNTARVVPDGLEAVLDRGTWALPAAVRLMEEHGVPREESERAFNCGVGMVAAVAAGRRATPRVAQLDRRRRPRLGRGHDPAPRADDGPGRPAGRLLPLSRVGLRRGRTTTPQRPRALRCRSFRRAGSTRAGGPVVVRVVVRPAVGVLVVVLVVVRRRAQARCRTTVNRRAPSAVQKGRCSVSCT